MLVRRYRNREDSLDSNFKSGRYIPLPPREELLHHFRVAGGDLWWRCSGKKRRLDRPAGSTCANGYRQVECEGRTYQVSRLLHYLRTGEDPGLRDMDHRDGDTTNNTPGNIRPLTHQQNVARRRCKGYGWNAEKGLWVVRLTRRGQILHYSSHHTEEEAIAARQEAEARYLGHLM